MIQGSYTLVLSNFSLNLLFLSKHSLPNNKILVQSKLKGLADNKINVISKSKIVSGKVENIEGKGENAGYQHFLLFPQCFQKASYKGCDSVVKG